MNTGTSYGSGLTCFEGLRVAGMLTYVPSHTDAGGKTINQHCRIPVYMNERRSDRPNRFSLTAWGKLADITAMLLAPGAEFNCKCRPNSYQGRVFDANGQALLLPTGAPILTEKISFSIVMDFKMIADSRKTIEAEILTGARPMGWDDGGAGQEAWRAKRKIQSAQQYIVGSTAYGHARVIQPAVAPAALAVGATAGPAGVVNPGIDPAAIATFMATPQGQAMLLALNPGAVNTGAPNVF